MEALSVLQESRPLLGGAIQRCSAEDRLRRAGEADSESARHGIRYVLAATAVLAPVADGVDRSLSAQARSRLDSTRPHADEASTCTLHTARPCFLVVTEDRPEKPRSVGRCLLAFGERDEGRARAAGAPPPRLHMPSQHAEPTATPRLPEVMDR
ncbi:hypothetical protein ABB37_05830 [Leptomonas pyrrhocoris]|uniref:Uncharacterized protein n=1 Tax=Leptomonas pyrrhocoris TaxID=157538 RepID=A0A0N0VEM7_LEPPY|nr:hypothetical protein ABB37_05830 [Leptomonas pyrrhocoris]KPA78694.1 hypothetical protein ABB37_05830 [Leptomonas pyrrhocoris]|eukprot:XP_015657133.1 hypothetical protein ABB37_05830 [Leptomonas pyrrhocoris]